MAALSSKGTEFIVLCGQVVGSGPFEVVYDFDDRRFDDRKAAIAHGLEIRGSDDAILKEQRLVGSSPSIRIRSSRGINRPNAVIQSQAQTAAARSGMAGAPG